MRSRETSDCSIQCLEFSGQGAAVEEELISALVPGQSDSLLSAAVSFWLYVRRNEYA